jgi:hypothetical protein
LSELTPDLTPEPLYDPLLEPNPETIATPQPARWSFATRLAFRFTFCYLMIYALCCGNATLWEVIPFHIGERLEDYFSRPFFLIAQWLGQHLFHLAGVGAKLHGTSSGDTILNWIAIGIMLTVAVLATFLWTALAELHSPARRSTAYPKLFFWFRLTLRLTLGYAMLNYGLSKVFPLQMAPPSLAVLNEPLGNTSPMTMLWTLIGLNPIYEMICGAAEATAGALILFRRTTLLGALLTAFLATNIVLYNFCYDVPVKIYAAHLLMMSLAVLAADLKALFNFFFLYRPCVPSGGWNKPARRYGLRIETAVTAVVLMLVAGQSAFQLNQGYAEERANARHPNPMTGEWHILSATKPYLTGDGLPMTDIFFDPSGRIMLRASDQALWRAYAKYNEKKHTLLLEFEVGGPITYAVAQPDPTHMVLTPTGDEAKTEGALTLVRVPLPSHYPLLDRGFHFVNEWGLER